MQLTSGFATSRRKTKDEDLPFTHLKELKPILNRKTSIPNNMKTLMNRDPDHNQFLHTFSSPFQTNISILRHIQKKTDDKERVKKLRESSNDN